MHSFLLKFLLTNKNLKDQVEISEIRRILQFEQKAFMASFANSTRKLIISNEDYPEKFGSDLKDQFLKNALEYFTAFPEEYRSVVVYTRKDLEKEIKSKSFKDINIFGENLVELHFLSGEKKKRKNSVLSLAIRDIAFASYATSLTEKANTKQNVTALLDSLEI